jgi:hypothetical protein
LSVEGGPGPDLKGENRILSPVFLTDNRASGGRRYQIIAIPQWQTGRTDFERGGLIKLLSEIQETYDGLREKHKDLLQRLDSLSNEVLSFKAGPDRWSIVEVVEHLVIAEESLIEQLGAEVHSPPLDIESRSAEKYRTVIKVMERDIEVDVPHESLEPLGRSSLDELLSQWEDLRKELHRLLAAIKEENKDDMVFRHPYAGPLDISETLHFFDVHFDNHMRQIDRILNQISEK